ncbi:MAG: hypothetical protein HC919_04875 [Oscillatoriales cyanobacterium SM2_2_1]|nr:hypothetical protein [Oscillatoriales cyanobacterium SM2_2_1]
MRRYLVFFVIAGWLWLSLGGGVLAAPPDSASDLVSRLEQIKTTMKKMRFCTNESCFYRELRSQILPPEDPAGRYRATISAAIDRPSASPDMADYHFVFIEGCWQLVSGEEYTDVADYAFVGDRYEIFSVHSSRSFKGVIESEADAGNIKAGYIPLYFRVLDHGVERSVS